MLGKRKRLIFWLVVPIVVLAGLGYYLYSEMSSGPEEVLETKKVSPEETPLPRQGEGGEQRLARVIKEKVPPKPYDQDSDCSLVEDDMADFFHYLDQKKYVKHLDSGMDVYTHFKKIVRKLAARAPIPAGEGIDPRIIIQNVYYFFRILDRKDLRLIKDVITNEQDTVEINLNMFYAWLTSGNRCPDSEGLRPSLKVLYQYAGFFLNTIGGRAYLFRRSEGLRLLVSYYCLLIVHTADKLGRNDYGIDIVPFINPVKKEISYYPNFQFQGEYVERLNEMEDYYLQRR